MARVTVTMHHGAIEAFLRAPDGPVHREVSSKLRKTEAIAVATAPVDEGRLKNARTSEVRDEGSRLVGRLEFLVDYAIFVIKGTGIFGPEGRPIRAKRGEYLVFRGRDGRLVYARQVKGQRPNPFLVNALKAGASPWPVTEH